MKTVYVIAVMCRASDAGSSCAAARVGLLAVEKDPQEVYAGMVDAAGILEDLAKAMLEGGLARDENTSDAQA